MATPGLGIESSALRGVALREQLASMPLGDRDPWIDQVFGFPAPPPDDATLPRGAVPYLPCSVDDILAMVREAPVGPLDAIVDIGSGLGRVAILAHLFTGARALGVEIQGSLVVLARARCNELALDAVTFVHGNAADLALDGSIFFLYAPCNGPMLRSVLQRIEEVARRRPIVVGAVDLEFPDVPWLQKRSAPTASLSIYDSIG